MTAPDWISLPLDPATSQALAAESLEYRGVAAQSQAFDGFIHAVDRGFLEKEQTVEQVEAAREAIGYRRLTGVYDVGATEPGVPVATVASWIADLTLDATGSTLPMWAISEVTVAPTHRRRGVARAMLEGELRTAASAGVAIAGLTVSEATIYGRFGFAPAAFTTDWRLTTARTRWIGPRPDGRLDAVGRERLRDELESLHDRVRLGRPGEIQAWPGQWARTAGTVVGQENGRSVRGVLYRDAAGAVQGALAYTLTEDESDFTHHTLTVVQLLAATDDAYAALWRFALEHDLVATVSAPLRSVEEPLLWMIADQRGAHLMTREHGWLRVLDVAAVLSARTYSAPLAVTLRVIDPLGFADGSWRLEVTDAAAASVSKTDAAPDLTLSVGDLASLLLGGVRARTLRSAGRIDGGADAASALDLAFASPVPPYLGIWY